MPPSSRSSAGVALYCGAPTYGKTYLMQEHAKKSRRTVIGIDSARRMTWPATVVSDPVEAIIRAYSKGESVRWIPMDRVQVNALCAGILRRGGIELLIDEITFWTLSGWAPQHLDALIRTHAPPLDVRIRMTTQDPTGFTRKLRTCVTDVYGFMLEDDDALKWVRMWFKERTEGLKSLKKRKYFEWHIGSK